MPSGCLPVLGMPIREETLGQTNDTLERLYLLAGKGTSWFPHRGFGGSGQWEKRLNLPAQTVAPATRNQKIWWLGRWYSFGLLDKTKSSLFVTVFCAIKPLRPHLFFFMGFLLLLTLTGNYDYKRLRHIGLKKKKLLRARFCTSNLNDQHQWARVRVKSAC